MPAFSPLPLGGVGGEGAEGEDSPASGSMHALPSPQPLSQGERGLTSLQRQCPCDRDALTLPGSGPFSAHTIARRRRRRHGRRYRPAQATADTRCRPPSIYYEEGNPQARVAPDVFLVLGASKHSRMNYKLWEKLRAAGFRAGGGRLGEHVPGSLAAVERREARTEGLLEGLRDAITGERAQEPTRPDRTSSSP